MGEYCCTLYIQIIFIKWKQYNYGLREEIGSAANDGICRVFDEDIVELEVSSAVSATNVEAGGGSLDVETIDHEDGGSDPAVQLLEHKHY